MTKIKIKTYLKCILCSIPFYSQLLLPEFTVNAYMLSFFLRLLLVCHLSTMWCKCNFTIMQAFFLHFYLYYFFVLQSIKNNMYIKRLEYFLPHHTCLYKLIKPVVYATASEMLFIFPFPPLYLTLWDYATESFQTAFRKTIILFSQSFSFLHFFYVNDLKWMVS